METRTISTTEIYVGDELLKITLTKQKRLLSKEKEKTIFYVTLIYTNENFRITRDWETYPEAQRDYINILESNMY